MIEIDKNMPLPPTRGSAGGKKYPITELEIGDSFLVTDATQRKVWGSVGSVAKRTGAKFTVRNVEGGVRVWRIA